MENVCIGEVRLSRVTVKWSEIPSLVTLVRIMSQKFAKFLH